MPRPNTKFDLTVDDLEVIETALRIQKNSLAGELASDAGNESVKGELMDIHDLLGRLHNQKEFFRPRTGPYLGG